MSTYRYDGDTPPTATGSGATGNIAWTISEGSVSATPTPNGTPTTLSVPNETNAITITARDLFDSAETTVVLQVQATYPDRGQFSGVPIEIDNRTNASIAEDGAQDFVEKGPPQYLFQYEFPNRQDPALIAARDFWLWHKKSIPFWLQDPLDDDLFYWVRNDSKFQYDPAGANTITYRQTFRQVVP